MNTQAGSIVQFVRRSQPAFLNITCNICSRAEQLIEMAIWLTNIAGQAIFVKGDMCQNIKHFSVAACYSDATVFNSILTLSGFGYIDACYLHYSSFSCIFYIMC